MRTFMRSTLCGTIGAAPAETLANSHCVLTTGNNVEEGLDVVLEGEAVPVHDGGRLSTVLPDTGTHG